VVRIATPKFRDEAQEAAWWGAHPEVIAGAFERAYGKKATKRPPTQAITIRIPVPDVARARRLAQRKGLPYQTFVKGLLHEALNREERA